MGVVISYATSITIQNTCVSICSSAFSNCYSITSIAIPDSVTSIGWNAFNRCSALTSIAIPDSVTSIGELLLVVATNLLQ